jgi:hypothetical protein
MIERLTPRRIYRSARRRLGALARRWPRKVEGVPWLLLEQKRIELRRRRTFEPADLETLDALARDAGRVVPVREFVTIPADDRPRVLTIRHDMDHEIENSVLFAEWEAAHGIRASYYVLHTDWYWGDRPGRPTDFLLRRLDRIAALGHEIGVHNNAIAAAVRHGGYPVEILAEVVEALRRAGFDVTGTVAHGDRLCRVARFINSEVFVETPFPEYGEPRRTVVYEDPDSHRRTEVPLRPVKMSTLGLSYEAGYVGRVPYLSDTGGHWNAEPALMRRHFAEGRDAMQVLAHPVWWAFSGEPVRPRPATQTPQDAIPTTR